MDPHNQPPGYPPPLSPSDTSLAHGLKASPVPSPLHLHQLVEQGPMLKQAEAAATQAIARQLPTSLLPSLLDDVDVILDLCLPPIIERMGGREQVNQEQLLDTLEQRVKAQLRLPRFMDRHLDTLRAHPILDMVLNPVIDGEVARVAKPQ